MTVRPTPVSDDLYDYLVAHGTPPDALQQALITETSQLGHEARLQISPDEGAFLTLVAQLVRARTALEIGTFTGYSALCIARGLSAEGKLICCDISVEWTTVARRYWELDGLSDRIELRIGDALETVRAMPSEPTFDIAFIDADYENYVAYWEEVVSRVHPGGIVLVDSTFYHGRIVDPADAAGTTEAVRALNQRVAADDRVDATMIAIADGLTLARKRP